MRSEGGDERESRGRDNVTEAIELVCHRLDRLQQSADLYADHR
jgi:hypothetical protein